MNSFLKILTATAFWSLSLMAVGLVLRLNWELFLLGWRVVG